MKRLVISVLILVIFALSQRAAAQVEKVDSLLKIIYSGRADTNLAAIQCSVCLEYFNKSEVDSAEKFCTQSIKTASLKLKENLPAPAKWRYLRIIGNAYNNIGNLYFNQGKGNEAILFHEKSITVRKAIHDTLGLGSSYNNLAGIYLSEGNYPVALDLYYRSLKMREHLNDKKGMGTCYSNIGIIQDEQNAPEAALESYKKALSFFLEIADQKGIAHSYNHLGNAYKDRQQYDKAVDYYTKSFRIREEMGDKRGMASCLNNLGSVYQAKNDYQQGLDYFLRSLEIKKKIKDNRGISVTLGNIGYAYLQLGKIKEALPFIDSSIAINKRTRFTQMLKQSYLYRSSADSMMGDFRSAFHFYKLYKQWNDSVINESNQKKLTQYEMTHEFEKKESETKALQEKKDAQQQEESRIKNIIIYSVMAGLLMVLLFSFFLYNRFRIIRKQKNIIESQKEKVEAQHRIIEEKQKQILDSIYYARRIQQALVTSERYVQKTLERLKGNIGAGQ